MIQSAIPMRSLVLTLLEERSKKAVEEGSSSSLVKVLVCWIEGDEITSQHWQSATVGHLSKAFRPQLFRCLLS